ncbi:hypothetical protein Y032_0007g3404 [Ancylostoma ceylanicum]|nr:hypothetical protein Y032_0007g3404 [Ancylostoma ceylanicum]
MIIISVVNLNDPFHLPLPESRSGIIFHENIDYINFSPFYLRVRKTCPLRLSATQNTTLKVTLETQSFGGERGGLPF